MMSSDETVFDHSSENLMNYGILIRGKQKEIRIRGSKNFEKYVIISQILLVLLPLKPPSKWGGGRGESRAQQKPFYILSIKWKVRKGHFEVVVR